MQKFKSNDRIVLKKDMDRPLDKTESIYRVVNFYKSRDGEYYYEMELAEPASDYLNNMALDSLGCMIWHDDEVVCQIDEEEQRRARVW